VVHVEASAGVVRIVAGWMLDSVMCAGMELGNPRVTVAALRELHQLLVERGLRVYRLRLFGHAFAAQAASFISWS
jgi:hypothetical protein